jgi:hypothetical protein
MTNISMCEPRALLVTCFTLVPCLAYSFTLKMEVTCSSETSVDFHIPQDRILFMAILQPSQYLNHTVSKGRMIGEL